MGIEGDLAALSFSVSRTRSLCRFDRALSVPGGCSSAVKQSAHADMSQSLIPGPSKWLRDRLFLSRRALWKHGHPNYSSAPRATTRSIRVPFGQPGNLTFDQDVFDQSGLNGMASAGQPVESGCGASDSRIEATLRKVLQRLSQFSFLAQPSAHNSIHTLE